MFNIIINRLLGRNNTEIVDSDTASAALAYLHGMAAKMDAEEDWIRQTLAPSKSDFALIGAFIQTYCIADFNARRVIDAFRTIRSGATSNFAGRLNETDVLLHLRSEANAWTGDANVRTGTLMAADILELHRVHRHNFAHWVVRRIPNFRGFVVLSNNATEAAKRDGSPLGPGEAKWGIFPEDLFLSEKAKMQQHSDYLAKLAVHLVTNQELLHKEQRERAA